MQIGVVGKPSVGKSTFFKAATLAEVEIANYPFTTIKPNEAVGYVKIDCVDNFFEKQCNPREGYCLKHNRFIPVQMIDVAGLVPGAHEGLGMGNQFLDDLRQADVLIHVIDISGSTNEKGEPVEVGAYNPEKDIKFLELELDMWYFGILKKGWDKFARQIQQEKQEVHKALGKQLSGLKVDEDMVKNVIAKLSLNSENPSSWTEENLKQISTELRKLTKPMIIACNKIDADIKNNYERIKQLHQDYILIPCSAESELALKEAAKNNLIDYVPGENDFNIIKKESLIENQKKALLFIKENILTKFNSTGIQEALDTAVFKLLNYAAIYPGGVNNLTDQHGNTLPDCFLMPPKSTALDFAYRLHTDFGKNFIRAIDVKTKRTVGKEHPLNQGDVIEIISNR